MLLSFRDRLSPNQALWLLIQSLAQVLYSLLAHNQILVPFTMLKFHANRVFIFNLLGLKDSKTLLETQPYLLLGRMK